MQFEINEKGSEKAYKEFVNIIYQFRQLIKNPHKKISNLFARCYFFIGAFLILIVMNSIFLFIGSLDSIGFALIMLLVIGELIYIKSLTNMNKMYNTIRNDKRTAIVTVDEKGVEINKEGSVIRTSWDKIAYIRKFQEILCFITTNEGEGLISLDKKYMDEIKRYVEQQGIDVVVIE